jgi:hypothetical protein
MAAGAIIRVKIRREDEHCRIDLSSEDEPTLSVVSAYTWQQIAESRREVAEGLKDARDSIEEAGGTLDASAAAEFLTLVARLGDRLLWRLFGTELQKVAKMFERAFARVLAAPLGSHLDGVVEVDSVDDRLVLFEVLPLVASDDIVVNELSDLVMQARRFVGMSAIVRRVARVKQDMNPALLNSPHLSMKMFYNAQFDGSREEAEFFLSQKDHIHLDGPWPHNRFINRSLRDADVVDGLVDSLLQPWRALNGRRRKPPDQIQHFSCHCDTSSERTSEHFLHLWSSETDAYKLPIGAMEAGCARAARRSWWGPRRSGSLPLVFLNACHTATQRLDEPTHWATAFLTAGYRGFIGTETGMPDGFAAEFAKLFYTALLGGKTAGAALQFAKWRMLERRHNPLGLLYTFYGNPDLKVETPLAK